MLAECIRSNQTSQAIITHYNHRLSVQYPFVSGNPRTNNQVGFFNQFTDLTLGGYIIHLIL